MVELSLGWLAAKEPVTSILVGASSPHQVIDNAKSLERPLDAELIMQVDQVTDPLREALGSNVDLWQSGDASRVH